MIIRTLNYFLYTSSNNTSFQINLYFWFLLKLYISIRYGINMYMIFFGFSAWSFWEYTYHRFLMHGLKNTVYYHKLHGHHHLNPSKPAHVPIFQYLLVCPSYFIISYFVNPSYVFSYALGHMVGMYCFEKMHFFIHNDVNNTQISTKYNNYH